MRRLRLAASEELCMAHGSIEAGEGSMREQGKRPAIVKSQASSESFRHSLSDRTNDFSRVYLPFSSFLSFFSSSAKEEALNVTATAMTANNMLFIMCPPHLVWRCLHK